MSSIKAQPIPPPLPASMNPSCGRVYSAYLPSTNSGCSTTFLCWRFDFKSGSLSQLIRSLVRAIPAVAVAEERSPFGALLSYLSAQKMP